MHPCDQGDESEGPLQGGETQSVTPADPGRNVESGHLTLAPGVSRTLERSAGKPRESHISLGASSEKKHFHAWHTTP